MKNLITCHCHQSSLDTASTPEAFAAKEEELGTGHLVVTDHGTLNAAWKVFSLAKKKKLTPIIGLEGYFRDDDCPILASHGIVKQHPRNKKEEIELDKPKTLAYYLKYMHLTMHAQDQEAFETMVRLLSKADGRAEKHGSEKKPLFTWADLEELGSKNITMTSSCLGGVIQRHLLDHNNLEIATQYYEKMRSICKPGNWYAEIGPHKCDKYWDSAGYLIFKDGTRERLGTQKRLKFKDSDVGQLKEFARRWKPGREDQLLAVMDNRKWVDREPKVVVGMEIVEGFLQNECRPWAEDGDVQKGTNLAILHLAEKYGDKVLIGDDSHYASPEEKIVQDIRLQTGGGSWRFYGLHNRKSSAEALEHFRETIGVSDQEFESWVENSYDWASKFKDFSFKVRQTLPTSFYPSDTLGHTMDLIEKHGRMRWDDPVWVERLQKEIEMLHQNGVIDLLPYFMIDEEVCSFFASKGKLTGPGRGSAAGMLLAYLLRITHVDPIKYNLSMERFLTPSRVRSGKQPDIDQDLSKKYRDLLIDPKNGYLKQRFGDCYAHISTDTSLKLKSSVKDVARVMHDGRVPEDTEAWSRKFLEAPQGIKDLDFIFGYNGSDGWVEGSLYSDSNLQQYVKRYPQEWEIVQKCLGLTRHKNPHACAFLIANEPVTNFIPMTTCDEEPVTQYTAASVEAVGGLKMDFLGLNSLDDIAEAIAMVQKRAGWEPVDMIIDGEKVLAHEILPFKGGFYSIWKLPEDQAVFRDICEGKTETVFQFSTEGVVGWMKNFDRVKETRPDGTVIKGLDSIEALGAFTALDRPGPLDFYVDAQDGSRHNMLVEFARRAAGEPPVGEIPALTEILPETYGVITYQEQLQRIFYVLGKTTLEEADDFRIHISKKQAKLVIADKEVFMRGAVASVGEETAQKIWESMETFAAYGFNKSHAIAYVTTSYACAFLKHHFNTEWWCSVLRHATKDEISTKFWKHCGHMIDLPDAALSGDNFDIVNGRIRAPLTLLLGVGEVAHEQLLKYRPYKSLDDFCEKIVKHQADTTTQILKPVKVSKKVMQSVLDEQGRETGEQEEVDVEVEEMVLKDKKGHNALNKGVIATLIISGAMDSLFPPDTSVIDAMDMYVQAMVKAKGKKRVTKADKFDEKFLQFNAFRRYQMRKAVLPAYTEPCLPQILTTGHKDVSFNQRTGKAEFMYKNDAIPFEGFAEMEYVAAIKPWPSNFSVTAACAGYVADVRKFNYGEGKTREAIELIIDIDGGQMKAVKWGGARKLESQYRDASALKGAIVVALYTKYSEDKPFVIEDLTVIQPPLDHTTAEQSPDP